MDAEERAGKNPTSFPPSAFFPMPIPGRDTPEDTPPSSIEQSQSPEKGVERGFSFSVSDDSEPDGQSDKRRLSGQGIHKRKAGGDTRQDNEEEDDDGQSRGLPSELFLTHDLQSPSQKRVTRANGPMGRMRLDQVVRAGESPARTRMGRAKGGM